MGILEIMVRAALLLTGLTALNKLLESATVSIQNRSTPATQVTPAKATEAKEAVELPVPRVLEPEAKVVKEEPSATEQETKHPVELDYFEYHSTSGTESGFSYRGSANEVEGEAVLLEYVGDRDAVVLEIPSYIANTEVACLNDNLCAGLTFNAPVELPYALKQIGSNVFNGAKGVHFVFAYSPFEMQEDSFEGCDLQAVVLMRCALNIHWTASGNYRFFRYGDTIHLGKIEDFVADGNRALYAITDSKSAVLMDLVDDGTDYTIPETLSVSGTVRYPVEQIDSRALDHLKHKITIHVPISCYFDITLQERADFQTVLQGVDSGFLYHAFGEDYDDPAMLLEYVGDRNQAVSEIPSMVPSLLYVSEMADDLCAGLIFDAPVELPGDLRWLGSSVFNGAKGVHFVFAYSSFKMEEDSFVGCDLQAVVLMEYALDINWTASGDYRFFRGGDATQYGKIKDFAGDGNRALYALTDQDAAILMDLVDDGSDYVVPEIISASSYTNVKSPVRGIDSRALENLSHKITIHVPEGCSFDVTLQAKANFEVKPVDPAAV